MKWFTGIFGSLFAKQAAILVAIFLFTLASASAQTKTFFDLVKTGTPSSVKAAIANGANVNAKETNGESVLMYAAANNPDPEVITILLKAGADMKARDAEYGKTPLMWSAQFNKNPEVTTVLLKAGADIEARSIKSTQQSWTALMWAAQSTTNPEVISTLVKAGANIKTKDDTGLTVLMIGAEYNANPEVITRLIKAGADVNATDQDGLTPLIAAASKNQNPDVVAALLKAGANAKVKNKKGFTALDYGKYNKHLAGTNALSQLQNASQ